MGRLKQFTRTFLATAPLLLLFGVLVCIYVYSFTLVGMDLFAQISIHDGSMPGNGYTSLGSSMLLTLELLLNQNLNGPSAHTCHMEERGDFILGYIMFIYEGSQCFCLTSSCVWILWLVRFHAGAGQRGRWSGYALRGSVQLCGRHVYRQVRPQLFHTWRARMTGESVAAACFAMHTSASGFCLSLHLALVPLLSDAEAHSTMVC